VAVGFFIAHLTAFGAFFATAAIFQTLGVASAQKHLSKDHRRKTDGV
jgi:hypothetical protein